MNLSSRADSTSQDGQNIISIIKAIYPLTTNKIIVPANFKCAAVVIPLVNVNNVLNMLLTKRTESVRDHQNQVSFPGGVCEESDNSLLETAVREFEEEIGVKLALNTVIGGMLPRKTITGYFIAPFIVTLAAETKMHPNPLEVQKVIKVPISWLDNHNNYSSKPYQRNGLAEDYVIFYEPFEGEVIWGITAQIIRDFLDGIKK